jgi:hypothetical protein
VLAFFVEDLENSRTLDVAALWDSTVALVVHIVHTTAGCVDFSDSGIKRCKIATTRALVVDARGILQTAPFAAATFGFFFTGKTVLAVRIVDVVELVPCSSSTIYASLLSCAFRVVAIIF